ncbi:restriction endonuclease subunit S [Flavihumibacter rivuli]|uniref:restriction endonuclease subunit S n=1 Tax=Flavihumibacter rivuli TaxID=2838156 RepID=UPI001BDEC688|nr:restriction endonuclease subunit S [Flavihumibacter rivuli]ULQ55459.1 restriction endonuclease subunit S [Flavihumibacter rivuli]
MVRSKNIPVIRFQEFTNNWISEEFENISERASDKYNPDKSKIDYPCIELESLDQDTGILLNTFSSKEQKSIKNKFNKGDVLFGKLRPYLRKFHQPNFEGVCSSEIWVLRGTKITNRFLYYLLQAKRFSDLMNVTSGSKMPRAEWSLVSKESFFYPSHPEQQKIASFLTAVDEKIQQLSRKKKLLEQYKKGVMQKFFNQEIRFKPDKGGKFPDWEEKNLGEISVIKRGASPRPISSPKWFNSESNIGWVRISDVTKSNKFLTKTEQYLSKEGIAKSRLVPSGNIIMSISATIGKPIYTTFEVCIHDGFVVFEDLQAEKEFLFYYLDFIKENWYRYGQPGTQINLNSEIVSCEPILVPCNKEQQKIASFLSALDDKLNLVSIELDKARKWKKGLLQQMFV